jgi:hypothetical protein
MKRNIHKLLILAMVALTGCQKLDREIVTTITHDQFYSTYSTVSASLLAAYAELPDGTLYMNGNGYSAMLASATDEAEFTEDPQPVQLFNTGNWNAINNPDNGSDLSNVPATTIWAQYYRGIRLANEVIVGTSNVNSDYYKNDPSANGQANYAARLAELKRWTYEARFLRAYFYFELVKRYGGVPLITQALPINTDLTQVKRSSLSDCVNFISNECDSASVQLPSYPALASYAGTDLGRATKFAALALKSRVLLYAASDLFNSPTWATGYAHSEFISLPAGDRNARWKAASDAALACITALGSPALTTNYKTLFNTFNNSEIIFTRSTAASNTFEKNNSPIGFALGTSGNTPTGDLVDAYEVRVGTGAGATSVPFDWNNPIHLTNIYNFSTTSAVGRDPRLGATVITNGFDPTNPALTTSSSVSNGITFGTPARFVQTFAGGLDALPITNATKTGYYLRKYQIESLNLSTGQTGVHSWIIFRIPEMYLNYAEALNEWSPGNPDIAKYVNMVRSRTGVAMPNVPVSLSQTDMRTRIRNEDRIEFAFEDHRAWDTRRWMIAPTTLGAPIHGVTITKTSPGVFSYLPFTVENRVFNAKMYLYPIPQNELNTSPALLQNPLW